MDEERENQIEDHKQQLKLKIIKSSEWVGDDERKPSVLLIKNEIDDDDDENQIQIHHQQEINTTSTPPLPRICEYCGKGFSSGKALGGHKRYHIQEARKYGAIIPKKAMKLKLKKHKVLYDDAHGSSSPSPSSAKINNTSTTQEEKEKEKPVCCLCHKEFPSMKSLFGHMRSHRDRDWRGIQPPPMVMSSDRSRSRSSSCSPPIMAAAEEMKKIVHDDDAVDEAEDYYHDQIEDGNLEFTESRVSTYFEPVEVLRSWCKTNKRGRKSSIGDRVAAERLVSLSLGEQEQQSLMVKKIGSKIINKSSGYDSDDSYWLREDQELELELHVDKQQWSTTVEKNLDYGGVQQARQQPNDYDVVSNKRKMTTTKKDKLFSSEKRPRKSGGLLEVNNLDGGGGGVRKKPKTSFKCSSCGKSFPTFQALGGHRSSHNKDKHSNPSTVAEDSAGVGAGTGAARANKVQVQVDVENNSMYNEKLGTCKSSSSQVDVQYEAPLMTSEASESSQTGPRKVLDFDLNETYVMEDYEEEDGAN